MLDKTLYKQKSQKKSLCIASTRTTHELPNQRVVTYIFSMKMQYVAVVSSIFFSQQFIFIVKFVKSFSVEKGSANLLITFFDSDF